ncbi:hypothetical protein [Streptomyces olivochromogenes]|uniref:hypothetical protein n=1 Tax=Streptomyces olivochromogenes TaxID=1963 RepID=UPI0036AF0445
MPYRGRGPFDERAGITELRENLDGGVTREDVYQTWCDNHSRAFGNAYVARDNWRSIGIGGQVDLLMKSTASGFRDIFELKQSTSTWKF